jgi:hypothetical protein
MAVEAGVKVAHETGRTFVSPVQHPHGGSAGQGGAQRDPKGRSAAPRRRKAGVVVTRLECPKCQHVEGRHPKGAGTWKDIEGKSAG